MPWRSAFDTSLLQQAQATKSHHRDKVTKRKIRTGMMA
jgi:hypothetical protein